MYGMTEPFERERRLLETRFLDEREIFRCSGWRQLPEESKTIIRFVGHIFSERTDYASPTFSCRKQFESRQAESVGPTIKRATVMVIVSKKAW